MQGVRLFSLSMNSAGTSPSSRSLVLTLSLSLAACAGKAGGVYVQNVGDLSGFGITDGDRFPGVVVADTHCIRISGLLGLTDGTKDPAKVEQQLRAILPPEESNDFCHRLVLHGRAVCIARRPQCQSCVLRPWCDHFAKSGQTARGTEGREPA